MMSLCHRAPFHVKLIRQLYLLYRRFPAVLCRQIGTSDAVCQASHSCRLTSSKENVTPGFRRLNEPGDRPLSTVASARAGQSKHVPHSKVPPLRMLESVADSAASAYHGNALQHRSKRVCHSPHCLPCRPDSPTPSPPRTQPEPRRRQGPAQRRAASFALAGTQVSVNDQPVRRPRFTLRLPSRRRAATVGVHSIELPGDISQGGSPQSAFVPLGS